MINKERLGIRILGVVNIIFAMWFLFIFAFSFFMGVLLGWVTDEAFRDAYEKFVSLIIGRLMADIRYIFSFLLAFSGISMVKVKNYSRKLAIRSIVVLLSLIHI